jgi:hypothetical protein
MARGQREPTMTCMLRRGIDIRDVVTPLQDAGQLFENTLQRARASRKPDEPAAQSGTGVGSRHRARRLGIVPDDVFGELDTFEKDVTALKNHAIEYLIGGEDHPDRWIYKSEGDTSHPSLTLALSEHLGLCCLC